MLHAEAVTKTYPRAAGIQRLLMRSASSNPVQALRGVDLHVAAGEIVGLVGPNGAGKTTLLRIVSTLADPTTGEVTVAGHSTTREARQVRERIGLVLADDRSLYWRLNGRENLEFFAGVAGYRREAARRRATELLERVGLAHRDKLVFGYSSGMRARLSLARALLAGPRLLLLDEATRALDPVATADVGDLLRTAAADGVAVLLSSHRLDEIESLCDRLVVVAEGLVRFEGTAAELAGSERFADAMRTLLTPDAKDASLASARDELVRIAAVARRDLRSERTYPFRYVMWFFELAVTSVVVFHLGKLITDTPALAAYGGRYFEFAMVGLAMMSVARLGVGTFSANIMAEQSAGTLEVLLVSPIQLWVFLTGSFIVPLLLTAVDLVMYFGVGIGIVGHGLDLAGLLLALPLVVLTLATFCAFGILGAAIGVLVKRGDPVSGPVLQLTSIMSGALFPVAVFPGPIRAVARAFPAYYGITGVREAMLGGAGFRQIAPELAVLAGFVVVLLPLSVWAFGKAIDVARSTGVLGTY